MNKIKILPAIIAAIQPILWWGIWRFLYKYEITDTSNSGSGLAIGCIFSCALCFVLFVYLSTKDFKQ